MSPDLTFSVFLFTVLWGLWIATVNQLPQEAKEKRRVRFMPIFLFLFSFLTPQAVFWLAEKNEQKVEDIETFVDAAPEVYGRSLSVRYKDDFDSFHGAKGPFEKTTKSLLMTFKVYGWTAEQGELQVSLIQAIKACYPQKTIDQMDALYQVPLNRGRAKQILNENLKNIDPKNVPMFCNFETLKKLI